MNLVATIIHLGNFRRTISELRLDYAVFYVPANTV